MKTIITKTAHYLITAAFIAAVFFGAVPADARTPEPVGGMLPAYSKPVDRTRRSGNIEVTTKGRRLTVFKDGKVFWSLPEKVLSQDFLLGDIDRDGADELVVLCWKIGRYGKRRPTWVKEDEKTWSQHIFIYDIRDDAVVSKWMSSDTGIDIASIDFCDGVIIITDTDDNVTDWIWGSWGLEKI